MRLEERHRGPEPALAALRADPTAAGLTDFVTAIFQDFLLDNPDGAAFVLRNLPRRPVAPHRDAVANAATVESLLLTLAKALFSELLLLKATEALGQHVGYQAV